MKKFFYILILVFVFIIGCAKKNNINKPQSVYQKINKMLINLKSYKADVNIKYISNKNTCEYKLTQYCKADGKYKIEIKEPENSSGNIILCDGKKIYQFNSKINGRVNILSHENPERSEIFLTSFIKNYSKSLETSVGVANILKNKCTVLEAQIPGEHPFLSSEKLFIDNQSLKPVELIIYDKDNSERIVIVFSDFEYNIDLVDSTFVL